MLLDLHTGFFRRQVKYSGIPIFFKIPGVCVCVCVCERERETEREKEIHTVKGFSAVIETEIDFFFGIPLIFL